MKRETVIASASILLGIAAAGTLYWVQRFSTQLVPVLVAARDVEARQVLQKEDLRYEMVIPAAKDQLAIQDPDKLMGQVLVSPIYTGEQIRPGRIDESERDLTSDEVAIAFPTDLTKGVGGLLEAGDVVDIYVVPPAGKVLGQLDPWKLGEGFRVLSVRDGAARATGPRVNSDPTRSQGAAGLPAVVVLKVPKDMPTDLLRVDQIGTMLTFAKRASNMPVPEQPIIYPLPPNYLTPDINGLLNGTNVRPSQGDQSGSSSGSQPQGQVRP